MAYSNSRIKCAFECEYQYYKRYVLKQYQEATFSFFIIGNLVHGVIEHFYASRISYPKLFSSAQQTDWVLREIWKAFKVRFEKEAMDIVRTYRSEYDAVVADVAKNSKADYPTRTKLFREVYADLLEGKKLTYQKKIDALCPLVQFRKPLTDLLAQAETCLINFVNLHNNKPASIKVTTEYDLTPAIEIAGLEKGGRIDRIEEDGCGEYKIYDYKTGAKYWNVDQVSQDDQLLWYAYALSQTKGFLPSTIGIYDLLHDKTVECELSQAVIDAYIERLEDIAKRVLILDEKLSGGELESYETPISRGESHRCSTCSYSLPGPYQCKLFLGGVNGSYTGTTEAA